MKELCCASSCQQLSYEFQTWEIYVNKPNKLKWKSPRAATSLVVGVAVNGVAAPVAYEQTASIDPNKWMLWILQDSNREFIVAYPSLRTHWKGGKAMKRCCVQDRIQAQWENSCDQWAAREGHEQGGTHRDSTHPAWTHLFLRWRCTKAVTKSLSRIDHIEGIKCYESESTPQHLQNSQRNPISIFSCSRCRRCWICRQTRIVTVGNLTVSVTKKGKQRGDVTKSRWRNQIMTNRINNQKWASRSRKDFFIKAFEAFLHRCYILHWRLFHTLCKFWFKEGCRIAKHLRRKMYQVSRFLKAYHVPGDLQRRALFSVETIRKRNLRFQEILVTSLHFTSKVHSYLLQFFENQDRSAGFDPGH